MLQNLDTPSRRAAAIATVAVALGLADLPYGYYLLLRLVLCIVSLYLLFGGRARPLDWQRWALGGCALLYNPVLPVQLGDRTLWEIVNVATVALFWNVPSALSRSVPSPSTRPSEAGNPLTETIEALAGEKGIEPEVIIAAMEEAVLTASRRFYETGEDLRAKFNIENGQIELFAVKTIVESVETPDTEVSVAEAKEIYGEDAEVEVGYQIEFPKRTDVLGRIAAQTAKQVIFEKIREAERENIYDEYHQRVGEVMNGTVKRFEQGDIIVEVGRIEAILPRKEQSRAESYSQGDRVRAVVEGVSKSARGPQVVLSRSDPALLIKLLEQEVPEIFDGTVIIRGAVREAGDRAKVAVYSREHDVDPVGACLGMKGTRVQAIVQELRGEKIDIVEFSDDPVTFVTQALSPAKVQRVSIVDDEEKVMEVVVEDEQLSLAIGKKGQNVRLAAKLTGWRIDIKSEEEKRREVEAQFGDFPPDAE